MGHRPGTWRRRPLPPDWETRIRPAVLERDGHVCQWLAGGRRCSQHATDVDHINPDGPDELWNLWALCAHHHRLKTASEGGAGWGQIRRAMAAAKHRPPERHPGLK